MFDIIVENKKISFADLNEFYKWLMKHKSCKDLFTTKKAALDLYNFFKFYINIKNKCEEHIKNNNDNFINDSDNSLVKTATKELIRMNSDGKFLRATLIALGYLCKNNLDDYYLPLASAYETFQTSILIHDDIIDNATVRRGKVTIPEQYNNNLEILNDNSNSFAEKKNHISNSLGICIGDLGFYLSNKIILENYHNDKNLINILNVYNDIVINTIKGEIIDVMLPFNEKYQKGLSTEKDVMEIYKLKTAWYTIIGPFTLGMTLADFSDEQITKMEPILYNLGVAFQIKDDILGIFGNEVELGKSVSSDISEFKQTILYTYVSNNNKNKLEELHKYYGKDNLTTEEILVVKEIFKSTGALDYANSIIENLFIESKNKLEEIDFINEDKKSILNGFITYLYLRNK